MLPELPMHSTEIEAKAHIYLTDSNHSPTKQQNDWCFRPQYSALQGNGEQRIKWANSNEMNFRM